MYGKAIITAVTPWTHRTRSGTGCRRQEAQVSGALPGIKGNFVDAQNSFVSIAS